MTNRVLTLWLVGTIKSQKNAPRLNPSYGGITPSTRIEPIPLFDDEPFINNHHFQRSGPS